MSSRPRHLPTGKLCARCNLPASIHAAPRNRKLYFRNREKSRVRENPSERIIGIDGEGQSRRPHRYTFLAAGEENGKTWSVANSKGLTTEECFDFLLSLPPRSLCFGYAFVYDLTKICRDLPPKVLGRLFHESTRQKLVGERVIFKPERWHGYTINYMNRRFTLARGSRRMTLWDIFRFFATKFTGALKDWKVATPDKLERMERMKALRSTFDKLTDKEIHEYCKEECAYLAQLGKQLLSAHDKAGLPLRDYFGAGSTASSLLGKLSVRDQRGEVPDDMREPIACAFFGGRFENSRVGPVSGPVYDYDIHSAYPYHATTLPCLLCGRWRYRKCAPVGTVALIHWTLPETKRRVGWGPFPVRDSKGAIRFPLSAREGWTWSTEYFAGERLNPAAEQLGAWVYEHQCSHQPFAALPGYYRERVRIGKDGPGLVIKLGLNSVYGKLAQSRGFNPKFQSWVWAGMITSGCRAQLLDAIAAAPDPDDVIMLATDGIWTTSKLKLPAPRDTGTSDLEKPLGGWGQETFEAGIFAVRPGIYFPLSPTDEQIEKVRARGLGRRVLYENWQKVVRAFSRGKPSVVITGVERFIGAKSGCTNRKGKWEKSERLGEWVHHPITVTFNPEPKRRGVDRNHRLLPYERWLDPSVPYSRALISQEALMLKLAEQIAIEQPDTDFVEISGDVDG